MQEETPRTLEPVGRFDRRIPGPYDAANQGRIPRPYDAANQGRIPYGASTVDPENVQAAQSKFSSLAFVLSLVSIVLLLFPYVAVPVSVMAVLFGIVGLRRGEFLKKRAITGIVIGVAVFLFATVMMFCLMLLMPYGDELTAVFQNYLNRMR